MMDGPSPYGSHQPTEMRSFEPDDDSPQDIPAEASHVDISLDDDPAPERPDAPPEGVGLAEYADWALERSGGWGRFQKRYTVLLNLTWALCGAQTMVQVFTTLPPHRHRICVNKVDRCDYDAISDDDCSVLRAEYEYVEPGHSVASDFELICESSMLLPLLGTLFFLGFFAGAFILSGLADSRGRRRAFFWSLLFVQLGAFVTTVAPSYTVFALGRSIVGFGVAGAGLIAYVWNTEMLGSSARSMVVLVSNSFFAGGAILLSPISSILPQWRHLCLVLFLGGLPIWGMQLCMLESPKWLASQKRASQLHEVLCRIAEFNGCCHPPPPPASATQGSGPLAKLADDSKAASGDGAAGDGSAEVIRQLMMDPRLSHRFYPLCFAWFTLSLAYYGLCLNVSNLGMNIYISSAISSLVEIPGYVLAFFAIDDARFGRRATTSGGLVVGGASCLLGGLLLEGGGEEDRPGTFCLVLLFFGKLAVALSFAVVYMYAAELFPTSVRSRSIGLQSLCARVGGMMAPMVASLGQTSKALPMLFFGLPCLVSGISMLRLPETLGKPLADSVEELPVPSSSGGAGCFPCLPRYSQLEEDGDGAGGSDSGRSGRRGHSSVPGASPNSPSPAVFGVEEGGAQD